MKKFKYIFLVVISFLFCTKVYANDIRSINMDIYVDSNGDAHVTEKWAAVLNEGTEGYKPYYNLGNSRIEDFRVSLNGREFTPLSDWDVDASFSSKAYKSGINIIDEGYELCFGISTYGSNVYTMEYTITNFVSTTDDADMIYWQLIPYNLSDKPESVYVKIHSDFAYSDDLDVWGFGYGDKNNNGYAYVYDGYIELTKDGSLDSDEYVTVLVKFPKNTFHTNSVLDNDFSHYLDMAQDGATTYTDKNNTFFHKLLNVLLTIFAIIFNFLPYILIFIVCAFFVNTNEYGTKRIKIKKDAKKLKDVPYFRDLPCNKDVFKAYWVAGQYGLVKNKTDFLGTLLLKWLKSDNIENVILDPSAKKPQKAIKLVTSEGLDEQEKRIYNMMLAASNDDVLEKDEFEYWCKKNYKQILGWFNNVIDNVTDKFVQEGLITEEKKTLRMEYVVSDTIDNYAKEMAGLKKFLNEFSNIKDREAIEVKIWDEYLMYAQIFGIADKVAKEFKRLYPDVITDEYFDDVIFLNTISYSGVHAASVAKSRAESYSSGGGGFSSSGGGGGSFGGGGGGGGFR